MAFSKTKNIEVEQMYQVYLTGKSLAQIAKIYGVTRQSVHSVFASRKLELRPRPIMKPYQEFNGNKYTKNNLGYMRKTGGDRRLMHIEVWEFYNGPIPDGWDIHHKDNNKANNDINNFECLPKAEHTRLYASGNNQFTKGRKMRESA